MKRFLFGILLASAIASTAACTGARNSHAGSAAKALAWQPLQLLDEQSRYVCLSVVGLQHNGIDTVLPGNGADAIPLTWDGLGFSASLADPTNGGRTGPVNRVTYAGTIAADGEGVVLQADDLDRMFVFRPLVAASPGLCNGDS